MNRKIKYISKSVRNLILLLPLIIFILFPFIVAISTSLKTEGEINLLQPTIIPQNIVTFNYSELFSDNRFVQGIKNSILVGIVTMLLTVIVSFPAAYIVARLKKKSLSSVTQIWILLSKMVPIITLTVPLYKILQSVSLTDSLIGLILVYMIWQIPTTLWLLRGFINGFPQALEDAAKIDGCNTITMFIKIMVPNILPGVLTAGVFAFIGAMNEFFFALCFLKSPANIVLSIKLYQFIGLAGQSSDGLLAAAAIISSIPGIILFSIFQKYYVHGVMAGAEK